METQKVVNEMTVQVFKKFKFSHFFAELEQCSFFLQQSWKFIPLNGKVFLKTWTISVFSLE